MQGEKAVIDIENRQNKVEFTNELESILKNCVEKTLEVHDVKIPIMVGVLLVDDNEIRELNHQFRGIDKKTDVLSFPMLDIDPTDLDGLSSYDFEGDIDPESQAVVLGDIVISLERARQQAEEYHHSFLRELGFLMVHGMLHLLGYDHMEPNEASTMRNKEEEVLGQLGLVRD